MCTLTLILRARFFACSIGCVSKLHTRKMGRVEVNLFSPAEVITLDKPEKDLRDIVEDLKLHAPHEVGLIKKFSFSVIETLYQSLITCIIQKSWNWSREQASCNYVEYQRHTKKTAPHWRRIFTWKRSLTWFIFSTLHWSHKTRWTKRRKETKFRFN